MNAVELNRAVLERLGSRDEIYAAEMLKDEAVAVAAAIAEGPPPAGLAVNPERLQALVKATDAPSERMLAVLFPVLEYGGPEAIEVIPRSLLHVARPTGAAGAEHHFPSWAHIVVGRLVWSIATYALHCGRLKGLAAAWRAVPTPQYEGDKGLPLLADTTLRHPDALGTDAGAAYIDYQTWLAGRELMNRYALLIAEVDDVFAEADFLLAMRTAVTRDRDVYSVGFTPMTVARFRGRLDSSSQRAELASLFGVTPGNLDETLARAYAHLKSDQRLWGRPPDQLFA